MRPEINDIYLTKTWRGKVVSIEPMVRRLLVFIQWTRVGEDTAATILPWEFPSERLTDPEGAEPERTPGTAHAGGAGAYRSAR